MKKIQRDVISDLIAVGLDGQWDFRPSLSDPVVAWQAVLVDLASLEALGQSFSEVKLKGLIRGLVLLSVARGGSGGSGTPVAPLFRDYAARFPKAEGELTRWIISHRENPYDPFGGLTFNDAPSMAFRNALLEREQRQSAARAVIQAAKEARDREPVKLRATRAIGAAVGRGDLRGVIGLLAKGADPQAPLPDGTSLIAHAEAHGHLAIAELLRARGTSSNQA